MAAHSSIIGSIWGGHHHGCGSDNVVATDQAQYLTDEEISRFLDDLDHNGDGMIDYDEVEQKLDAVHDELIPQPREHNILARKRTQQLMRRLTRLHSRAGSSISGGRDKEQQEGGNSGLGSSLRGTSGMNSPTGTGTGTGTAEENRRMQSMDGAVLSATTTRRTTTSISRGGAISRILSMSSARRMTTPTPPEGHHFQRGSHRHTQSHQGSSNYRHEFLRSIIGSDARRIPREEFAKRVKEWNIPSMELNGPESNNRDYVRKMSLYRRIRAYWAVHGPEIAFLMLVIGLQLAFGIWQLVKYTREQYENAFGWGIGMAKAFAGALYPTMFFLIISMSRYVSTFLRRSYWLSRFINWDLSQSFHVKISIVALVFSTLHTVGHLTGTFRIATEEDREDEVAQLLGDAAPPGGKLLYQHFVVSVPGTTGIIALVLFYLLALLSMPAVRRWNYEVFQLGHLLMYPIIGFLIAHGSAALLQYPMLGFWMAVPTVLVLLERLFRVGMGFHDIQATVRILDGETVEVTVVIPNHLHRLWVYKPGQYVFFQVPKISRFQWHPFTVSVCVGKKIQLLIKTDGNWTRQLRALADESGKPTDIIVGINGPFGAPAQRFYDYDHAIIVGSGIGVTPFSGILSDLQARDDALHAGPGSPLDKMNSWNGFGSIMSPVDENEKAAERGDRRRRQTEGNLYTQDAVRRGSTVSGSGSGSGSGNSSKRPAPEYRRVDFHWTVRERNYLLWMSELLNNVFTSQQWHRQRKLDEQEQRRMSKQRHVHHRSMPPLHLQRTMSSSKVQLQRTMSSRSRQNSYIPPPNLPSTPSAAFFPAATSPTSPTSIPENEVLTTPCSPLSPFSTGFPRGTLSQPSNSTRPSMSQSISYSPLDQQQPPLDPEDLDTLPNLDIRIHTHITGILSKSRSIATHVYAWLLETHRTAEHPASPLTGLLNPTRFGRPDFVTILDNHYEDMVRLRARDMRKRELERESKEQERLRRVREKERRIRKRREREREERERKRRERERERELREKAGVINKSGGVRDSTISFAAAAAAGGGGGGGNSHARSRSRNRRFSLFGADRKDPSTYNIHRRSNSDMTLCSAGHVDSWYVYSSAAPANTVTAAASTTLVSQDASSAESDVGSGADAGAGATGDGTGNNSSIDVSGTGQGPSLGESATTIINDNASNSSTTTTNGIITNSQSPNFSSQAGPAPDPGPTFQPRAQPQPEQAADPEPRVHVIIEEAIAQAVQLEEATPEQVYIGSSSSSSRGQASRKGRHRAQPQTPTQATQAIQSQPQGQGRGQGQGQGQAQAPHMQTIQPASQRPLTNGKSLSNLRGKPSLPALTTSSNAQIPCPTARAAATSTASTGTAPTGTGLTSSRTLSIGGIGISTSSAPEILRIGVFYCGTPAVGSILADRCRALTARGHAEGTGIEYHFLTEVFG